MPSSLKTLSPGADAPKRSTPTLTPLEPTYRSQPIVTPASTETRASTSGGKTKFLYSSSWASKISHDGMLTTLTATPCSTRRARASKATATSEPVAIRIRSEEHTSELQSH